jgi:hypothetical protein
LEVEAVVREACEQVLTDPSITHEKRVLRATALNLAAEAFLSIKKEGTETIEEFVKVDTAASKQREAGAGAGASRPPVPPPRPDVYPKEKTPVATGPVPPRPPPNSTRPGEAEETLGAAYKACKSFLEDGMGMGLIVDESKRRSQNPPGQ